MLDGRAGLLLHRNREGRAYISPLRGVAIFPRDLDHSCISRMAFCGVTYTGWNGLTSFSVLSFPSAKER